MPDPIAIEQDFLRSLRVDQQGPMAPPRQVPQNVLNRAFASRFTVGGPEARMAMFPNEYAKKPEDKPGIFERGFRGIAAGITQMIPASMTLAGGILDFVGADEAGQAVAGAGISLDEWLGRHVAVENPTFFDHLMMGIGSMASFMLPGIGAAGAAGRGVLAFGLVKKTAEGAWLISSKGGPIISMAGKAFQAVTGAGSMAFLESAVEQSQRQQELMARGMQPAEALEKSQDVFWQNMALLMVTNLSFWSPGHRVARAALGFMSEGAQERAQGVIQDVAAGRGKWSDFTDPEKYGTETLVGAIVGGGAGFVMPGEAKVKEPDEDTTKPPPTPGEFEQEPPPGYDVYKEPVLRGPSEVPGEPPVSPAPGAGLGEVAPRGVEAVNQRTRELVDRAQYDDTQTLGVLERALIDDFGGDVDLAAIMSPGEMAGLAGVMREARALNDRGNVEQAQVKAVEAFRFAENRLRQHRAKVAGAAGAQAKGRVGDDAYLAAQAIGALEQSMSEEFGVDIDFASRLTPDQIDEIAEIAAQAEALQRDGKNRQAWAKSDEAYELAKSYLFRGEKSQAQQRAEQEQRVFAAREQKKWDYRAQKSVRGLEKAAGAPDLLAPATESKAPQKAAPVEPAKPKQKTPPKPVVLKGEAKAEQVKPQKKPAPKAAEVEKTAYEETRQHLKETAEKKIGQPVKYIPMHVDGLTVVPGLLQKRGIKIDNPESGTNEAKLQAIQAEFNPKKLDPVVAWRDPSDGKLKVIDGHHTLEVAKRNGVTEVNVKIFEGTQEEAIQEARELNDRVTVNDPFSRAATVRANREGGMPKKLVETKARSLYKEQAPAVIKLSHLDPKGKALSTLKALNEGSDEYGRTMRYAKWIGEARERFPSLTNQHEREMFDFLVKNGNSPGLTNATQFISLVESRGVMGDFSGMEALNLNRATESKGAKLNYERKLAALQSERKAAIEEKQAVLAPFKQAVKNVEDRIASSTNPGELDVLGKNLNAAKKDLREALARVSKKTTVERGKPVKGHEIADKIAAIESDIIALKQEWRAAQDALAGGGEQSLFSINITPGQQESLDDVNTVGRRQYGLKGKLRPTTAPATPEAGLVEAIAKRFGRQVVWVARSVKKGKTLNGWYDKNNGTVFLNTEFNKPALGTAMHEVTHHMQVKHPDLWVDVQKAILQNMAPGYRKVLGPKYKAAGYTNELLDWEIGAELMAEVATKDSFWRQLKNDNPRAFSALVNKLLDVLKSIRRLFQAGQGYVGLEAYANDFAAIERAAAKAFKTMSEREFGTEPTPGPAGQGSLFSVDPGAPSYMKEKIAALEKTEKDIRDRWKRGGARGIARLLYQKLVDNKTWSYRKIRETLKMMGKDWYTYDVHKNPYYIERMARGWGKMADFALHQAVWSFDGKTKLADGLVKIIKKYGIADAIDNKEFGMFMIATRLKAMHKTLGDSFFGGQTREGQDSLFKEGLSDQERAARAEFDREMREIYEPYKDRSYKNPDTGEVLTWEQAVQELSDWSDALMRRLWQSGMLSEEEFRRITEKYDIYAPLFVLEQETGRPGKFAYEMNQLKPGLVRMDPMQGMIKNAYRLEYLNWKNHLAKATADFVLDQTGGRPSLEGFGRRVVSSGKPLQDYIEKLKSAVAAGQPLDPESEAVLEDTAKMMFVAEPLEDGVVAFKRDGEMEYWQFDKDIYDLFLGDSDFMNHPVVKVITQQTKVLRAGAVLTPEFMARNQWRDFQSAAILATTLVKNPKDAFLLPARLLRSMSSIIKKDDAYKDFIMSGAGFANMVSLDQTNLVKEMEALLRKTGKAYNVKKLRKSPVTYMLHAHPLALLQVMSGAVENVTRLAVMEKVYADLRGEGVSHEEASARATIQAREASTDFSRTGAYGKIINRFIPFFNASVQGQDKLARTLLRDKGGRTGAWVKGMIMITAPSILLWLENHDEEWYKEQPLWLKNHFWLFSFDGGKTIHKLPKPFDVGLLFGSLPERFLDWAMDEDPKAMKAWAKTVKDDVIPSDIAVIMGPLLSSMNEAQANYDNFRDAPIVKGWMQDVAPKEQYTANTSEFAKWLGSLGPGRGLSPMKIDHVIRGSMGGLGSWGAEIASNMLMAVDPKRKEFKPSSRLLYDTIPDWMPVIKGFTVGTPSRYSRQMDDFYEAYGRSVEAINTLRFHSTAAASKEKYLAVYREFGVDAEMHEMLKRMSEPLGKISKQIRAIEFADPSVLTREEKQKKRDELLVMRNKLADRYIRELRKIDRDELQKKIDASVDRVGAEWERSRR